MTLSDLSNPSESTAVAVISMQSTLAKARAEARKTAGG